MKRIICMAILVMGMLSTYAQTTVKGKVVDAVTRHSLAGATISVDGNSVATTDNKGEFQLDCSKALRISVSFVGFETAHYTVRNCNEAILI
ncbi:MAG: carboxypeptidase-like regulatory domain-containing protein, partial [Bacteroidota bacterium]|nr:carboxypeptidase-like regulatory domain-containing protein [Bacteroidota bacterium]